MSSAICIYHFDGTSKQEEVKAVVIFNYATWYQFKDYFSTLGSRDDESSSIHRIVEVALLCYFDFKTKKETAGLGTARNRFPEQAAAARAC